MRRATSHADSRFVWRLQEEQLESALPLLGIAATVGGYTVMEAQADVLECVVTEGLTEDAVTARLHEGGPLPSQRY